MWPDKNQRLCSEIQPTFVHLNRLVIYLGDTNSKRVLHQAHLDLSEVEVGVDSIDPLWLPLYGEKHGKEVRGLGEVRVAVWFTESGAMGNDHAGQKQFCNLRLLGLRKRCPFT